MIEIAETKLIDMLASALTFGIALGIIIGIFLAIALVYLLKKIYMRNFKIWFLQSEEEKRKHIIDELKKLEDALDEIASESNTKWFKILYNDLNKLQKEIKNKDMQS